MDKLKAYLANLSQKNRGYNVSGRGRRLSGDRSGQLGDSTREDGLQCSNISHKGSHRYPGLGQLKKSASEGSSFSDELIPGGTVQSPRKVSWRNKSRTVSETVDYHDVVSRQPCAHSESERQDAGQEWGSRRHCMASWTGSQEEHGASIHTDSDGVCPEVAFTVCDDNVYKSVAESPVEFSVTGNGESFPTDTIVQNDSKKPTLCNTEELGKRCANTPPYVSPCNDNDPVSDYNLENMSHTPVCPVKSEEEQTFTTQSQDQITDTSPENRPKPDTREQTLLPTKENDAVDVDSPSRDNDAVDGVVTEADVIESRLADVEDIMDALELADEFGVPLDGLDHLAEIVDRFRLHCRKFRGENEKVKVKLDIDGHNYSPASAQRVQASE